MVQIEIVKRFQKVENIFLEEINVWVIIGYLGILWYIPNLLVLWHFQVKNKIKWLN